MGQLHNALRVGTLSAATQLTGLFQQPQGGGSQTAALNGVEIPLATVYLVNTPQITTYETQLHVPCQTSNRVWRQQTLTTEQETHRWSSW